MISDNGDMLWVTGGQNADHQMLSLTEFITPNLDPIVGPSLPVAMSGHCIVEVRRGSYMFIGI